MLKYFKSFLIFALTTSVIQSINTMDSSVTVSLASKCAQYCNKKVKQYSAKLVKLKELENYSPADSPLNSPIFSSFNMKDFYVKEIEKLTNYKQHINAALTQATKPINTLRQLIQTIAEELIGDNTSEILKLNNVILTSAEVALLKNLKSNNSNES